MIDEKLKFPVDFSLKVVGHGSPGLVEDVLVILERHFPRVDRAGLSQRPSRGGKYTALTVAIRVESREQLEAAYLELGEQESVLWAL